MQLFESVDTPHVETGVGPDRARNYAAVGEAGCYDGLDELADFEARTFKECDRASLSALRIAIRPATARARRLTRMRRRLFGRRHAASRHGRYRDSARVARQKPLHQG